jgi:hypothetical protein
MDALALHHSLERFAASLSEATVVREWTVAKAWLRADLSKTAPPR